MSDSPFLIINIVAKKPATFIIDRQRLCSQARYFARAFGGGFLEARTARVTINYLLSDHFAIFAQWIATNQLDTIYFNAEPANKWSIEILIRLYIMVDRFDTPEFRGTITDKITEMCFSNSDFEVSPQPTIDLVLDNIPGRFRCGRSMHVATIRRGHCLYPRS